MDQQEKHSISDDFVWAIVGSGSLRLIGKVHKTTVVGDIITFEACEYRICFIPIQMHPNAPPSIMWKGECLPLDNGSSCWNKVQARVDNIRYLNDMALNDANTYEKMVNNMEESMRLLKLQRESGIISARG